MNFLENLEKQLKAIIERIYCQNIIGSHVVGNSINFRLADVNYGEYLIDDVVTFGDYYLDTPSCGDYYTIDSFSSSKKYYMNNNFSKLNELQEYLKYKYPCENIEVFHMGDIISITFQEEFITRQIRENKLKKLGI